MAATNYTLKLTLKQANIVRDALAAYKQQTHKTVQALAPDDGKSLRMLYVEIEQLERLL